MGADQTPGVGTWIAGVLFLGGLAAGPGYWVYSKTYSGKLMEHHEIRHVGAGFRPITVALSPDMNPVGMSISASYTFASTSDKVAYVGVGLNDGKTRLAHGTATFEPGKDKDAQTSVRVGPTSVQSSKTVFLDAFTVPRADNYTFQFSGTRPGESFTVRLSDVRLELRRNMKPANMKIVWAGTGVLVFSLLFGWMMAPSRVEN